MKKTAAILATALLMGCGGSKEEAPTETYIVKKQDIRDRISQTGEVAPIVKVEIKSEASGKIEKLFVREGQEIKKGDPILHLDPKQLKYQRDLLALGVKEAKIELKMAERELLKAKTLHEKGSTSERDYLDSRDRRDLLVLNVRRAELKLKDITDQLAKTKVLSPMNGVVTNLPVEVGEIAVSATSGFQGGTDIATVADISKLEIISRIGEADFIHLKNGQKVEIRPEAIENSKTTGTITFLAKSAKKEDAQALGTFEVRIAVDSIIPGIAPGITVNVDFILFEKKDVLAVPAHFLQKDKEGSRVFLKGDSGTATNIELGVTDYTNYEVLTGLSAGDTLVLPPYLPEGKGGKK